VSEPLRKGRLARYELDFAAWTEQQGRSLKARQVDDLDWDNLAEEIEALARRDRHELLRRIVTFAEHLAKLEFSPAALPRPGWISTADPGWISTLDRERQMIADVLDTSPSLGRFLPELVSDGGARAVRRATAEIAAHGEQPVGSVGAAREGYAVDEVLGPWLPPSPQQPASGN